MAYAASLRLARFATVNEVGDWFNPQHTLIFANAVHQAVSRSPSPGVMRGIFHAALAVYMDRFLNVPPARLPPPTLRLIICRETRANCGKSFFTCWTTARKWIGRQVCACLRAAGYPIEELIDTLVFATVREDSDFHTIQVLEAGVQQVQEWSGGPEVERILIGVGANSPPFAPRRVPDCKRQPSPCPGAWGQDLRGRLSSVRRTLIDARAHYVGQHFAIREPNSAYRGCRFSLASQPWEWVTPRFPFRGTSLRA